MIKIFYQKKAFFEIQQITLIFVKIKIVIRFLNLFFDVVFVAGNN
jgi:hypothetical protein